MNMTALYSCFGVILGLLVLALIALGVMQFLLEKKRLEFEESENDVAAPLPLEVCAEDVLLRIRNAEIDTIAPLFSDEKEPMSRNAAPCSPAKEVEEDSKDSAESDDGFFSEAAATSSPL